MLNKSVVTFATHNTQINCGCNCQLNAKLRFFSALFYYYKERHVLSKQSRLKLLIQFTWVNFMATNLKPFCSKRLMISPVSPLCTPSGLMAMNVRSSFPDIELKMKTNTGKTYTRRKTVAMTEVHSNLRRRTFGTLGCRCGGGFG